MAIVAGAFFCMSARLSRRPGAQAGTQSSGQTSVQAGQTQAQASANASASTSASAQNGQANGSLATGTAFKRRAEFANRFEKVQAGRCGKTRAPRKR